METTNHTRALIARAADQVIRELSRTPIGGLQLTGAPTATPWVSVSIRLGNAGGVRYVRAGAGMKETGYSYAPAPGLIEAIAKHDLGAAVEIVERIVEFAVAQAVMEWERAG